MRFRTPAILGAAAFLSLGVPVGGSAQDYWTDVRPVLVQQCMGCHSSDGIAWSMEDGDRTFERRRRIASAVLQRRMPPWLAEGGHQAYVDDLSLAPEVLAMVERWAEADFPEGAPRADPPRTAQHAPTHLGFQADVTVPVLPAGSFLPDQEHPDEYRCFVVDWPGRESGFMTGFRTLPGERKVAHHTVVYYVEPGMVERYRELEGEDGRAGYTCFGGALPDRILGRESRAEYETRYPDGVRELARANWWLAHWAPGMFGHVLPAGTGVRMEPGAGLVVQMHYYTGDSRGVADAGTRMEFMTAAEVDHPAVFWPGTNDRWLGGEQNGSMVIAPGTDPTYRHADVLGDMVGYVAQLTGVEADRVQALEIHSANLHMHGHGKSGEIALIDRNGRKETLLSVPRWDLRWQRDFTFPQPKVILRADLPRTALAVECTFENTTERTVYGGYGSDEEMCFNFSLIAVQEGEPATPPGSR